MCYFSSLKLSKIAKFCRLHTLLVNKEKSMRYNWNKIWEDMFYNMLEDNRKKKWCHCTCFLASIKKMK